MSEIALSSMLKPLSLIFIFFALLDFVLCTFEAFAVAFALSLAEEAVVEMFPAECCLAGCC